MTAFTKDYINSHTWDLWRFLKIYEPIKKLASKLRLTEILKQRKYYREGRKLTREKMESVILGKGLYGSATGKVQSLGIIVTWNHRWKRKYSNLNRLLQEQGDAYDYLYKISHIFHTFLCCLHFLICFLSEFIVLF